MTETVVQKQLRLLLEQQCAAAFNAILTWRHAKDLGLTLIAFDLGDADGHVAFKSSLRNAELVEAFELLLRSWRGERVRLPIAGITVADMNAYGKEAERLLPAGVGFSLLVGKGPATAYIASGDREGVSTMLENELLPKWRKEGLS